MLIAPGVVVSWNWTGDLRVSASGSSSQMACIVIVKETHGSEPWALEHVIIELDTFTALFRTSFMRSESMLSAQGSKVALQWSQRIRRAPALITGTGTGWGFAWFSPASSDNCRLMKPALLRVSPFTFLDAFAKFLKASLCPSARKENSAVTGRMLLKSSELFLFSRKCAEEIKFGGNRKNNRHLTWGTRVIYVTGVCDVITVFSVRYGMTPKKVFRL